MGWSGADRGKVTLPASSRTASCTAPTREFD